MSTIVGGSTMSGLSFSQRVVRRWAVSIIIGVMGFFIGMLLVYVMVFFVVFIAIPLEYAQRQIVFTVVAFLTGFMYLFAWAVRGIQNSTIDVIVRDMGPLQKKMLVAQIQEDENGDKKRGS